MDVFNKKTGHILLDVDFAPGSGLKVASFDYACMNRSTFLNVYVTVMAAARKEPVSASVDDVEFFEVYEHGSENLLGGMFAIVKDGQYFGSLIGDKEAFIFTDASFKFVKTESFYIPLSLTEDAVYFLVCKYAKDGERLEPYNFRKRVNGKETVLLSFARSAYLPDVIKRCYDLIGL